MKDIMIITGGTSGLGLELVRESLKRGLFVCNMGRNEQKMKELKSIFKEKKYEGFVGDVTNSKFISESLKKIAQMGNIKYLINCAEKACFKLPIEYTSQDIDLSLNGLKGMILCSTETLKVKSEKDLKIVNIMSSAALKGNKQEALYCAAKWGERGYTESLKAAYKGTSVKIIGVYPGGMNTEFWNKNREYVSKEKASTFMKPEDVSNVILDNIMKYENLNVSDIIIERN